MLKVVQLKHAMPFAKEEKEGIFIGKDATKLCYRSLGIPHRRRDEEEWLFLYSLQKY